MNGREQFLAACRRETLERPPVWLMRQAGRFLPEYRKLKEQYDFVTMVKTPELAAKVTMQPIDRFGFDAAIIFSDILVIPEALGQPYSFREKGGIQMDFPIRAEQDLTKLHLGRVEEHLQYVPRALELTRSMLGDTTALIGFSGSPWTLATYMVEGGSSKSYEYVKGLIYQDSAILHELLELNTQAIIQYLHMQVNAGVDAVQVFDSWAGILSKETYWQVSGQYIARIVAAISPKVPVIVYAKGAHVWLADLKRMKAQVLGLDWTVPLDQFHDDLGGQIAVQGNLDPVIMSSTPEIVRQEALKILDAMHGKPGHIFNLGHGILPSAKIECVETLVETVKSYSGNR
ncbi:MAG: uroporphyrinogen decarboxylase [Candidatus Marinimicrobia bacterium]|nr:uroporphyrinogen decarboxylase [Candidatus Neomarinimicrobiota bacterium]